MKYVVISSYIKLNQLLYIRFPFDMPSNMLVTFLLLVMLHNQFFSIPRLCHSSARFWYSDLNTKTLNCQNTNYNTKTLNCQWHWPKATVFLKCFIFKYSRKPIIGISIISKARLSAQVISMSTILKEHYFSKSGLSKIFFYSLLVFYWSL